MRYIISQTLDKGSRSSAGAKAALLWGHLLFRHQAGRLVFVKVKKAALNR